MEKIKQLTKKERGKIYLKVAQNIDGAKGDLNSRKYGSPFMCDQLNDILKLKSTNCDEVRLILPEIGIFLQGFSLDFSNYKPRVIMLLLAYEMCK